MTHSGHYCMHEGLNGCNSAEEYLSKFTPGSGDSSTGLALFDFESWLPNARKVIIDSDIGKSVEYSLKHHYVDCTDQMLKLKSRLDQIEGLHVGIEDIDESLRLIWEYLSDKPYDEERGKMLSGLDIKVKEPYRFDMSAFYALSGQREVI